MNIKKVILLLSIGALLLLFSGCDFTSSAEKETLSAEKILTAVAETVSANLSLTPPPSETPIPTATATATETPTPTVTASATPTTPVFAPSTGGQAAGGCDNAAFVSDVTIPDGTVIAPGAAFTKTWRIQNAGTCTWNTSYAVVFVSGTQMGGASPQLLTADVAPGSSVDISVAMTAPATAGSYTGYWQLKNAAGQVFQQSFYVQIQVSGNTAATPTATATGPTPTPTLTPTGPTPTTDPNAANKADVKVDSYSWESGSGTREYKFTLVVANVGNTAAENFVVEWWAGNESGNTPANTWTITVPANDKKEIKFSYSYDNNGTYTTKIILDSVGNKVDESNEGNNTHTSPITV